MSVELLRQLDAYGDHVASVIDHVSVEEVRDRSVLRASERKERKRRFSTYAPQMKFAAAIAAVVLVVGGLSYLGGLDTSVDSNFTEIGASLGGDDQGAPTPVELSGVESLAFQSSGNESAAERDLLRIRGDGAAAVVVPETTQAPATTAAPAAPTTTIPPLAGSGEALPAGQEDRDIIFTANLEVAVTNAADAASRAIDIVETRGGFLFGERSSGGADATTTLTLKVPPAAFRDTIDRLGELGIVTERTVSADDVTEIVVDLESQITSTEVSVVRLRELLAGAENVNDIAKLERELTNRERDLEQLRGQLKTLEDRVALATIQATFTERIPTPKVRIDISGYRSIEDDGAACPGQRPARIEVGNDATICLLITNTGKVQLTDLELSGPGTEILGSDLVTVEGEFAGVLEPDEIVVLATDLSVTERLRADVTITATPINEAGDTLPDRAVSQTKRIAIDAFEPEEPDELPGFVDAWRRGVGALSTAGSLVLIVIGAVLPWLWLPALLAALVWWRRRRRL